MIIAITGTPGTGKSFVSTVLRENGYDIVDLNKVATEKDFVIGLDEKRNSKIINIDKLNKYVKENYAKKDIVFVEGHLSHLLKSADKVIVLRCHPDTLKKRLAKKGWKAEKINENLEAETLDVILCEATDIHSKKNIFEINTTDKSIDDVASSVMEIISNKFKPMKKYKIGYIDWSEEVLKDF
jgi:adenylate kinase